MAAFGKATTYVISEKGLENGPILFDKTTKSLVSCKNSLLKKAQSKLRNETHTCTVSKCTLKCHEVVKGSCVKAIGVVNLADAIPERNTRARDEKTFKSLSRELQNGDIVFCSLRKENSAERSCRVDKLLFNMEERFRKDDNTRTGKNNGGKTVVPKQFRREMLCSKFANRNEGVNFQTEVIVAAGMDENRLNYEMTSENKKEKLPLIQGEKIKECVTREVKTCIPRRFVNLIKASSTDGNESLNEHLMGTEKAISTAKLELFKKIKSDSYKIKPDLFVSKNRKGYRVDRGYNVLETETREKTNYLTNHYLSAAIKVNNQRQIPPPLIPLNGGYLSRNTDHKRGPFPRIKAPVFVDENTGKSHTLPGVVTFEKSDYNKWSRHNRVRSSLSTRYARQVLPSIEKNS